MSGARWPWLTSTCLEKPGSTWQINILPILWFYILTINCLTILRYLNHWVDWNKMYMVISLAVDPILVGGVHGVGRYRHIPIGYSLDVLNGLPNKWSNIGWRCVRNRQIPIEYLLGVPRDQPDSWSNIDWCCGQIRQISVEYSLGVFGD